MKRFVMLVTVVLVMVAMMVAMAVPAMAHAENNPCPAGVTHAHGTVPLPLEHTAHHSIPCHE
jgi:hypothetical protein